MCRIFFKGDCVTRKEDNVFGRLNRFFCIFLRDSHVVSSVYPISRKKYTKQSNEWPLLRRNEKSSGRERGWKRFSTKIVPQPRGDRTIEIKFKKHISVTFCEAKKYLFSFSPLYVPLNFTCRRIEGRCAIQIYAHFRASKNRSKTAIAGDFFFSLSPQMSLI